jgi:molybdopterin-guanine dinucleotide biosynthesis adapter protein
LSAGAYASLIEGGGRILLHAEKQEWTLQEQIGLLSFLNPDYIIIEGHKQEDFPKAVFIRHQKDAELLTELNNIIAVFYWEESNIENTTDNIPYFHINDKQGLIWLKDYLLSMKTEH